LDALGIPILDMGELLGQGDLLGQGHLLLRNFQEIVDSCLAGGNLR